MVGGVTGGTGGMVETAGVFTGPGAVATGTAGVITGGATGANAFRGVADRLQKSCRSTQQQLDKQQLIVRSSPI